MKYLLTEKIGSGGMAEVFRAVGEGPEGFERAFVVKRIHPRLSDAPEFVRMFVDEAKISARLLHPNIVQVFDFAYSDGVYTIVMEPVEGVDMGCLFRALERRAELPPPLFVAEVARQVCRGLEFAHTLRGSDGQALGIVHRDVTPPNIMVDWNGTVKILDFGLARAVQELRTNLTEAGTIKGKMSYVSPEQIQGQTADARSDIFSLGIVLHELLSVRRLFLGASDLETLKMVSESPIAPPSEFNPEVKPGLDAIVMKALERNPAKRYQSAREMGDELEDFVLRRRYSTRALAEKARQLAPTEAEEPVESRLAQPTDAELPVAPSSLGGASDVIVTGSSTRRRVDAGAPERGAGARRFGFAGGRVVVAAGARVRGPDGDSPVGRGHATPDGRGEQGDGDAGERSPNRDGADLPGLGTSGRAGDRGCGGGGACRDVAGKNADRAGPPARRQSGRAGADQDRLRAAGLSRDPRP
ncbi:MAG: serine/threonine-protein kinase [Pseudomonadota bacterium]